MELGATFWVHSDHPLVDAVTKRLGDDYYNDIGPCDMLVVHENGRTTCLIQQWLGHKAKPKSCREYPFDGAECFGQKSK
jgi:hypothetical protein